MTGTEIQANYFQPFHYVLYLSLIFALMVAYYQWTWTKKCRNFVKVLVVKHDGGTTTEYAPKTGGSVALKSPDSNTTRMWPINKLSAIEMDYPGDGFIPMFLQKKIKTVVVDEEDWEPLLNRGSYTERVASPDVVMLLREISEHSDEQTAAELTELADSLSTAPTRDMVASPAVLGNVMKEKVSEMAVTISKDTFDKLQGILNRLDKLPNALIIYAGLGINIILMGVLLFRFLPVLSGLGAVADLSTTLTDLTTKVGAIMKSLGVS